MQMIPRFISIHSLKNSSAVFEQLNRCLDYVKEWMSTSKLKLNPDKTEFIVFSLKDRGIS